MVEALGREPQRPAEFDGIEALPERVVQMERGCARRHGADCPGLRLLNPWLPRRAPPLIPLAQALEQLLAAATPLNETEELPTLEAHGRVLAQAVVSALHVPPKNNRSMDGYAVRAGRACAWRIAAGVPAHRSGCGRCTAAGRYRGASSTGAPIPAGADAVVSARKVAHRSKAPTVRRTSSSMPRRVRANGFAVPGEERGAQGEGVRAASGLAPRSLGWRQALAWHNWWCSSPRG